MKFRIIALALTAVATSHAVADLKPDVLDCDPKKAARNAAMGATVGVSGRCDAGKVVEDTKDNVTDKAHDAVDIGGDKEGVLEKKDGGNLLPKRNND